jgi:hypothetical protein
MLKIPNPIIAADVEDRLTDIDICLEKFADEKSLLFETDVPASPAFMAGRSCSGIIVGRDRLAGVHRKKLASLTTVYRKSTTVWCAFARDHSLIVAMRSPQVIV